jgi:hypothetical protein
VSGGDGGGLLGCDVGDGLLVVISVALLVVFLVIVNFDDS